MNAPIVMVATVSSVALQHAIEAGSVCNEWKRAQAECFMSSLLFVSVKQRCTLINGPLGRRQRFRGLRHDLHARRLALADCSRRVALGAREDSGIINKVEAAGLQAAAHARTNKPDKSRVARTQIFLPHVCVALVLDCCLLSVGCAMVPSAELRFCHAGAS